MSDVVAGVDFGTQSVRVSIVDSERGPIGAGVAEYPVKRDKRDPRFRDAVARLAHERVGRSHARGAEGRERRR
jgi:ribulose kinase